IPVVFVGVMMHELGHALTGRAFGLEPSISFHGMGGLTSWISGRKVGSGKSFLISIAGPAVGIAVGILALVFTPPNPPPILHVALVFIVWVNLGWGVINLIPVMPLDGGNALRALLGVVGIRQAELIARIISIIVGGVFGLYTLATGNIWAIILLAMFTFQNI